MSLKKIIIFCIVSALALIIVLGWSPLSAATRKVVNQLRLASALNDGLVGYWSFDGSDMNWGNSSVEATDVSGQGRNGDVTNFGQSSVVAGIAGQALRFDGVDDYVELGDNFTGIVTTTGTYSMSVWLRAGDITLYKGIVNISPGASSSDRNGISISEGALQGGYYNGVSYVGNSQSIAANTWYHVVLVNTAGTVTFYINGASVTGGSAGTLNQNNRIGHNTSGYFTGLIDEVRLYNRALSAAEVKELYESAAPEFRSKANVSQDTFMKEGLVGYWPFDGKYMNWGTGIATDVSPSGNNGVVSGMATTTAPAVGIAGQALNFDGTNDWINAGSAGSTLTDNFTLSAWIKTSIKTQNDRIIARRSGASTQWDFMKDSSSRLAMFTGTTYTAVPTNTIDDGGWHLATVVINGSSSRFYADGLPIGRTFSPTITAQAMNPQICSFH